MLGAEMRERLIAEYGAAPPFEVVGERERTFAFAPCHFGYVVGTLLRNSGVATLRHHHKRTDGGSRDLPPVRVIVAMSDSLVQLKLVDEAGGIRRSSLPNVWSYRGARGTSTRASFRTAKL